MFKIFVRSIVFSGVLKRSLILNFNALLSQRTRAYSKSKKTKKMFRNWEFTNEANDYQIELQKKQKSPQSARQYRLVSYNILAQDLLVEHLHLYYGIDTQFLRWEHRLRCLQNELSFLNADILCIQEMQYNHLKEFVEILSEKRRMEYVYKKKTGHRTDGCAIIYDRDIFQLLAHQDLELYQPNIDKRLDRENVAIFAKFKLRHEPLKQLVIATTHLLYNPRRHDVRVAQAEFILKNLSNFAKKCKNDDDDRKHSYLPVILTGDMNSEPNSPPFIKLTSKINDDSLPSACQNQNNHTGGAKNCDSQAQTSAENAVSPLPATFSLKAINFGRNCASTQHDRWITVDYILRSIQNQIYNEHTNEIEAFESDIKVLSLYKLPTVYNCERAGKIPNQMLGSDHYLQAIEFMIV